MKVQNEMSTRISVDAVSAVGSLSAFRNAIRGASDAWRAQEVALKNSGNYTEAATARYRGLNKVIDLQKAKIQELRSRQEGLDVSNKKQADQFLKLEKQIQQANKQLSSYESQASRAQNAVRYQTSGLAGLQHAYRQSQEASMAYVNRLNAEHRSASASVEKYRQLGSSLNNLQSQYRKQEFLLKQVANDSGKTSDAYIKQREQLNKTATEIAKTKDQMKSMQSTINRLQPTGITRVDNAVVKLRDRASMASSRLSAGFDNIKNHMFGLAATATTVGATLVSSINKAASLQKTMVENQNLMSTAGEKSASVQREVNQMYADGEKYSVQYGYSQKTIAQGYQELIKRGYDGKQSLGAMKSILEAARASGDSFDDTMKVTTSTLEAFGMRSESTAGMMRNTAKAASILAKGADVTSTSFKSIGEAMIYAGSSAKASGVSLKETTAILGVLSNNGLEATQAGTGLQRILTRLAAPTDTAKTSLKKYNMSIDDFKTKSGKLKNVNEIFKLINKNVPKADRLEFFNKVFGQTAQNAASVLSRTASLSDKNSQSLAHVENQLKTAYSEDYVGKLARKNMNSAKNSQERFKYASQAIQIEIGRNMLPALSKASQGMANAFGRKDTQRGLQVIAKGLGTLATGLANVITFIGKHTTTVKVFGTAMLTAFAGVKLLNGIGKFRAMLPKLATGIRTIGTVVKIATLGFNPWVMAIEAVVAGFTLLYKHSAKFRKFVNGLAKTAANGMRSVSRWFKNTFKQIGKNQEQANREQIKANKQAEKNWRNFTNSLSRNWKSYWRNRDKEQRQNEKRNQQYWNNVRKSASRGWKNMESSARSGVNKVSRWYSNMNRSTSRVIQNMYRQHPKTFQSMYKVIQDRTKVWHDLVTGHWSQLKDDTGRLAKDQSRANKDIFEDMYSAINKKTGGWLGKVVDSWKDHMSQIGDAISNGKKKAGAAMADLANGVLKPFKTLIDDIQGGINWVLDKIGASKLGGSWSAAIPTFATGTTGNPDGLKKSTIGMVNDGAGSHWRELYSYKGQIGVFPNKRNFITFLPKGMSILNGEDSHKFMSAIGLPRFANGVGSFFDSLEKGAADAGDFIDKVIEHPVQALEDVFKKFIKVSTPIKFAANLITSVPAYVAKQAGNWIKKQFEELADPGGSGVERWRPYVIKALAMLHLSSSLVGKVLRQIQTESGGNPKAMGGTDGLADGHAMGLMQVKPGTFAANKLPGHGNIWNGFDNLLAGLNYARKRYGDSLSFLGQGHGYANGGRIDTEQFIRIAEQNKPEYVIPTDINKRSRAYQLLGEVIARFRSEEPNAQTTRDDQFISRKEFMSLESKLDQLISGVQQLVQVGQQQINATINSGNKFGMKANRSAAYTVMARDQRLNDYMSYRR
ncbi:phage tail tape measure protein [Limosilactobacillus reuteri]|uniref:phage tail tape measure protein n=1 Tax=Limosilactobacillus reuteri TaxID=1598 RepID=UPI00128C4437|nr:phage tail tape measure protein [Limosilactobacillus reuteri]MQB65581.1 phage tail tape measure protein [Limosilactobacillus reuteri]